MDDKMISVNNHMQLKDKESELQMLNLVNQQLKDENEALNIQLEAMVVESATKIDALEQKCYSLNLRLNQQLQMGRDYQDEIESLRSQMAIERQTITNRVNTEYTGKIAQLQKQITTLRSDLEASQAAEAESYSKINELESVIHKLQTESESQAIIATEDTSEDVGKLSAELKWTQKEKSSLSQECQALKAANEQLKFKLESAVDRLGQKDNELEEVECRASSYYNSLQKARDEVQELKMELELAKMEANTTKKKGNSLFSEVEDRRVQAEKLLISVQVENDSLKKQLEISRQNLHSLKVQVAALLQMSGARADAQHLESVMQQLSQATGEVHALTSQLCAAQQEVKILKDQILHFASGNGNGDETNYIQYLQALLQRKETELAAVQNDLQTKRLLMLAETEKLVDCERRLYNSEQQLAAVRSQNIRLQLRIDEMQLKLEPAAVVTGTIRKVKTEKVPIPSASAVDTKENHDPVADTSSSSSNLDEKTEAIADTSSGEQSLNASLPNSVASASAVGSCKQTSLHVIETVGESGAAAVDHKQPSFTNTAIASSHSGCRVSVHQSSDKSLVAGKGLAGKIGAATEKSASQFDHAGEKKSVQHVARTVHISASDVKNDQGCKTQ